MLGLILVGSLASGINAVAGGGSLISFPILVWLGLPPRVANATNSVALWPGSLAGAYGFIDLLPKTKHHLKTLLLPTLIGSIGGAWLLLNTTEKLFNDIVPVLILLASLLLVFQSKIKAWTSQHKHVIGSKFVAALMQFSVAVYGGYFGAGMGIMMLAAFVLYMEGTIHELNAIKGWLGVVINFAASVMFVFQHLVSPLPAAALMVGSIVGGFYAAKISQKVDSNRLRLVIASYGFLMAAVFAYKAFLH